MKSVDFDHKGKAYSLRFDLRAMSRAQAIVNAQHKLAGDSGHNETMSDLWRGVRGDNGLDPMRIIAVFCAAADGKMSYDAACDLVEDIGIRTVEGYVFEAFVEALPSVSNNAADPEPSAPPAKDGADAGNAKKD